MTNDPVLIAYAMKNLPNGKSAGVKIGVAFPHASGNGLMAIFGAMYNCLVLQEPTGDRRCVTG